MATTKSPDGKSLAWSVREEDLADLETLKNDLIGKADQAREDGRLYLASQYIQLVAMVSPEIKKIRDRFDRESLASVRKEVAALKRQAREDEEAERIANGEA